MGDVPDFFLFQLARKMRKGVGLGVTCMVGQTLLTSNEMERRGTSDPLSIFEDGRVLTSLTADGVQSRSTASGWCVLNG